LNVIQFLVEQEFDIKVGSTEHGETGFHFACERGHLNVIQFLVEQEFDMNVYDDDGLTGFHLACIFGHLNVVKFLVEQKYDMNAGCTEHGYTGFHLACRRGNLNVVEFLLQEGFDMNIVTNFGNTGFFWACFFQNLNVLQFLLQQGFEGINQRSVHPMTRLEMTGLEMIIQHQCHVSANKHRISCILLLIEAGAQYNVNSNFEEVILAIQNRMIEITLIKETIFETWTGRIAQAITDFTMESFTATSLQNLSQFLD